MKLFDDVDRDIAHAVASLSYGNPFLPERLEFEKQILGDEFVPMGTAWHKHVDDPNVSPNLTRLTEKSESLADNARARLMQRCRADEAELHLYELVVLYLIYSRYRDSLTSIIGQSGGISPSAGRRIGFYADFLSDLTHYLAVPGRELSGLKEPAHLFAGLFQIRRAFFHTFEYIIGGSMATANLRAAVWQSIFSHDMLLYRRELYQRMGDIVTLIMGPSGTGKELVARAIGYSRYIPFDPKTQTFSEDGAGMFHPVNLSALSATLIESELFGHRRGSFTGAVEDHAGWFEVCKPLGAVFLDEIGEIDAAVQVKLLRALETRTFQRIGEFQPRKFLGKILAATNRDLQADIEMGRIRADFYYRLCSDVIVTPSLRERIRNSPDELKDLLAFLARIVVGDNEPEKVASNVETWIMQNLGPEYPWPGNVRELAQCLRNVLIHGVYQTPRVAAKTARDELATAVSEGRFTADELLRHYCSLVYADAATYQETARRLGLDHRTVKSKIDENYVLQYRTSS